MKLMAKNPDDRYQSAAEMLRDLAQDPRGAEHDVDRRDRARSGDGAGAAVGTRRRSTASARRRPRQCARPTPGARGLADLAQRLATLQLGRRMPGRPGRARPCWRGWSAAGSAAPEDLLSERAEAVRLGASPRLWMAPDWEMIARASESPRSSITTPSSGASRADQEAAWLAVPGYFPAAASGPRKRTSSSRGSSSAATTPTGSGSSPPRSVAGTRPRSTRRSW